jgi:hypothetical protein
MLLGLFSFSFAWTKPAAKVKPADQKSESSLESEHSRVDSNKVHQLYMDGEFEAAITMLEDNLKETRQYQHDDSVFIYKHLGVMYAAQYETREKGKYYMFRLLQVEPSAKIMDMYASDMIYMIFKNIQEEYQQKRMRIAKQVQGEGGKDTIVKTVPKRETGEFDTLASGKPSGSSRGSKKWVWAGVGAATVAAGIGAYILLNDEAKAPNKEVEF